MHRTCAVVLFGCSIFAGFAGAAAEPPIDRVALLPLPRQVAWGNETWRLPERFVVSLRGGRLDRIERAVERWQRAVSASTGRSIDVERTSDPQRAHLKIEVARPGPATPELGSDESYQLRVGSAGASIYAATSVGALHALQTLRQLVIRCRERLCLPHVEIRDEPRFPWRGLMIDAVRHWIPPEAVERSLDAMAAVKMNVLHWHLSDDQSFRVESLVHPELHRRGSDGRYFSQDQIRHIVAFAADRGIRVVPEFDLPGHSRSWQIAYPHLASRPDKSYRLYAAEGIFSDPIDPTKESVYTFLTGLVEELTGLFPDRYFHMGGDEVDKSAWEDSDSIDAFMEKNGIADHDALQAHFVRRYAGILRDHDRIAMGWNDILHADLPPDVAVHVWNTMDLPSSAPRHPLVVSMNYYLDHMRSAESHYRNDPLALQIEGAPSPEAADRVLGIEAASWSELVDHTNVDIAIWPRSAAIAERSWSTEETTNGASTSELYRRISVVSERLEALGVRHVAQRRDGLRALGGEAGVVPLSILADTLEPTPFYLLRDWSALGRAFAPSLFGESPDAPFPLQPFTSTLAYESLPAARLRLQTARLRSGWDDPALADAIRRQLARITDNHEPVMRIISNSEVLAGMGADQLARTVRDLAAIGIEILDAHRSGSPLGRARLAEMTDLVEEHRSEPFAYTSDYLWFSLGEMFRPIPFRQHTIAIRPAIEDLVEFARGR